MDKIKSFELQEFAQYIENRVALNESRLEGLFDVLNAVVDEIRLSDIETTSKIATRLSDIMLNAKGGTGRQEILKAFLEISMYGQNPNEDDLQ